MHWDGGWHMGWMWLLWILLILVAGGGLWFLINQIRGGGGSDGSAEDTLKRRYASGEIDEETYERMLGELRK